MHDCVVSAGRLRATKKLPTDVKLTVAHIPVFGCKVWIEVPYITKKTPEASASPGTLSTGRSFGMHRATNESDRAAYTSLHGVAEEHVFPMKWRTGVPCVTWDDVDKSTGEEDHYFTTDNSVRRIELKMRPDPAKSFKVAVEGTV